MRWTSTKSTSPCTSGWLGGPPPCGVASTYYACVSIFGSCNCTRLPDPLVQMCR
jgi:hypothetical protein